MSALGETSTKRERVLVLDARDVFSGADRASSCRDGVVARGAHEGRACGKRVEVVKRPTWGGTMARDEQYDVRKEILRVLMQKVANDQYPSTTMLDMIEEMLTPDEVPAYAELLMERIRGDKYPSIPMMNRVMALR